MNETSFIAMDRLKVQLLCRSALSYITRERVELWERYIAHVNSLRARRWLRCRRKPLSDAAAKLEVIRRWPMSDPCFFMDDEETRINALLELTFADAVNKVIYLSCGDYALLKQVAS